jgi:hypothetical protein
MECDYTHLNHTLLMSQKSGHQRCHKGGLLYIHILHIGICMHEHLDLIISPLKYNGKPTKFLYIHPKKL